MTELPTKQVMFCACTSWLSFFSSSGAMNSWKTKWKITESRWQTTSGFYFLTEIPLSSTSTYPICHCCYDQSIWHKKGSFGFLQKCHGQHRYTNLKQDQCNIESQHLHTNLHPALSWGASPATGISQTFNTHNLKMSPLHFWLLFFHMKPYLTTFTSAFIKC